MKLARALAVNCVAVVAVVAVTSAASARPAARGCTPEHGKQVALSESYRYTLRLGVLENMYMPYQVRANHPKHGEVMLRGRMTGPALLTGGPIRHLEIQICTRRTDAVVTDANPTIIVADKTSGKTTKLPVAVMQDVSVGTADLHYGNNIAMPARHRYLVTVSWNDQRATFRLTAPKKP
jgi:hypothetical protein